MKQVSENPLAKQPAHKHRAGEEEQMETRILENSINKICRFLIPRSIALNKLVR